MAPAANNNVPICPLLYSRINDPGEQPGYDQCEASRERKTEYRAYPWQPMWTQQAKDAFVDAPIGFPFVDRRER